MTIGDQVRALPGAGINQTSFLFGAVVFAFLFYITTKGDLGKWLGLLGLAGTSGTSAATAAGATAGAGASTSGGGTINPGAFGVGQQGINPGNFGLSSVDLSGGDAVSLVPGGNGAIDLGAWDA